MGRQQLKHTEVGCSVLITLADGQGAAEVNCASPAMEEERGGIPFVPLMRCYLHYSFTSGLCPCPHLFTCWWIFMCLCLKYYQWISLSSYKVLHCSIFQGDGSHSAALAVCHKKAVPWFLRSQRETRRLCKACLMWVRVVSVLLIPASSKSKADSFL